jgi:hypothetical protein
VTTPRSQRQTPAAARPPAPPRVIPADGRIDLGDGDWVELNVKLTVQRMLDLLGAFDTYENGLADLKKGRAARALIVNVELAVSALPSLIRAASVRGEDGMQIEGHDEAALRQWAPEKLLEAGSYLEAVKASLKHPGI